MTTIWDFVEKVLSYWNEAVENDENVIIKQYSYSKSLTNKQLTRELVFDLYPQLKYLFNPVEASQFVADNQFYNAKPLVQFDPFVIFEVLNQMNLLEYENEKMVLKKDDSLLEKFYSKLHKKILPSQKKLAESITLDQLLPVYEFLAREGYIRYKGTYEGIKNLLVEKAQGNPFRLLNFEYKLGRYKDYIAFGLKWQKKILDGVKEEKLKKHLKKELLGENVLLEDKPDFSNYVTFFTDTICEELVNYYFWRDSPEEEFLKRKDIDPGNIETRQKNKQIYQILRLLDYFGISAIRENHRPPDANIVPFDAEFTRKSIRIIPEIRQYNQEADEYEALKEKSKQWLDLYKKTMLIKSMEDGRLVEEQIEVDIISKYVNVMVPDYLFPNLNAVLTEFFKKVKTKVSKQLAYSIL